MPSQPSKPSTSSMKTQARHEKCTAAVALEGKDGPKCHAPGVTIGAMDLGFGG